MDQVLKRAHELLAADRHAEAIALLAGLSNQYPNSAAIFVALGQAYEKMGSLREAESYIERATQVAPDKAEHYKQLADVQADLGKVAAAKANYEKSLTLDARYFQAHANFGNLLLAQGNAGVAIEHFQAAVRLRPDIAELHDSLGRAFLADATADFARAAFLQALKIKPNLATAHYNLARLMLLEGEFSEAVEHFRRATELAPGLAIARAGLVEALIRSGETEAAKDGLQQLKSDVPPELSLSLRARLATAEYRHADAVQIWQTLAQSYPHDRQNVRVAWVALAELHDKMGNYAAAFEAITHAHATVTHVFSREAVRDRVDRLINLYASTPESPVLSQSFESRLQPVFVFGMPRSGKSLTGKLLASHPQVFNLDERNTLVYRARQEDAIGEPWLAEERAANLSAAELAQVAADFIEIAEEYMHEDGRSVAGGITHVVSADPRNSWRLPFIRRVFPQAKFIHLKRHPLDNCLACYFRNFAGTAHAYANDLEDTGFYYLQHQRLVSYWRDALKIPMLEIRYGDLVGDPAATLRGMLNFLGLEMPDAKLDRKGYDSSQVGRWKHYSQYLIPLIEMLGEINLETDDDAGCFEKNGVGSRIQEPRGQQNNNAQNN
jgi:tetratricopeptide (TPR) repeat protein